MTAMAFTPGPNTTLSTALAANHGLRHAMRFVLAVPFGWCALLAASVAGLGALVTGWPALGAALRWAGVAYMLWLAHGLWTRVPAPLAGESRPAGFDVGFLRGVALQFVNAKAWLNALTISVTWISVEGQIGVRALQVLPLVLLYGFGSNFAYACVGASLRDWLAQGQRMRGFNHTMALVLAATAVWMLRS
jgi:threonine/homoserine/homoserine lactone efflux protein